MPKGVTSLNIKNENGSFTNVPIAVKAENVKLNNGKNLEDSVAYLDIEKIDSSIEAPIKTPLYQEDVVDHLYSSSSITPLSAAQGKVLQNEIDTLKTAGTVPSDTLSSEMIDIRNGGNGKVYPSAGTAVRSQLSSKEDRSNKVSSKDPITGELLSAGKNAKYPSIDFLQQFYYDISQVDELIEQAKNQIGIADWKELKDLRVGADGEQYDNAGLAVRTNIKKVLDKIDQQLTIFGLTKTMLFDEDYNLIGTPSDKTNFSGGAFAQLLSKNTDKDKVKYAFIPSKVTILGGGAYSPCDKITDVYINNKKENIVIDKTAFPSTAKIHYVNKLTENDSIINIFPLLNIYRQILDISTTTTQENIVELDPISSESQLNSATNMNKTYLFHIVAPITEELNVQVGSYCILNNYSNIQILKIIEANFVGIKTFKRIFSSSGWSSFADCTIPDQSITSTKYANHSIQMQHIDSDFIDKIQPSNKSGPEQDGNVLITSAAVYNATQNTIFLPNFIRDQSELKGYRNINKTYAFKITIPFSQELNVLPGTLGILNNYETYQILKTVSTDSMRLDPVKFFIRENIDNSGTWTPFKELANSSSGGSSGSDGYTKEEIQSLLANKADIEIGAEFESPASAGDAQGAKLKGTYTLMGNLCFITAIANIKGGWGDIDYSLPVAALANSACLATDGDKTYRISTDMTQQPTKLYIHTVDSSGTQNDGTVSFCLAYRYK